MTVTARTLSIGLRISRADELSIESDARRSRQPVDHATNERCQLLSLDHHLMLLDLLKFT